MGLKVSTISRMPLDSNREYFVYFLDYGWDDAYSNALYSNFDNFAKGLAGNKGVVVAGLNREEFADEVLNWHSIGGEDSQDLLPAILICGIHPEEFRGRYSHDQPWRREKSGISRYEGALLIPLRKICKTPDDVIPLIERILHSIRTNKKIDDFEIVRAVGGDGDENGILLLQPNFYGLGIDLKALADRGRTFFSRKNNQR